MTTERNKALFSRKSVQTVGRCLKIFFRPILKVLKILARTLLVAFILAGILSIIVGVTKIYPLYVEYKQMAEHVVGGRARRTPSVCRSPAIFMTPTAT